MKRWTGVLAASVIAAALVLGGCAGIPAEPGGATAEGISSSASGDVPGHEEVQQAYTAYLKAFYENDSSGNTVVFAQKDLDNNGVQELIVLTAGTEIQVYTFDGGVTELGGRDFMTGTLRLLFSDHPSYPGVIYFTVSGGLEQYGYLTVKDNALTYEKLWDEDYTGMYVEEGSRERVVEYSNDRELIAESKASYQENKDLAFLPVESVA